MGETISVPDVALVPDHAPLAVQGVALVELHESVEDWPEVIEEGEAPRDTVGDGGGGGMVPVWHPPAAPPMATLISLMSCCSAAVG